MHGPVGGRREGDYEAPPPSRFLRLGENGRERDKGLDDATIISLGIGAVAAATFVGAAHWLGYINAFSSMQWVGSKLYAPVGWVVEKSTPAVSWATNKAISWYNWGASYVPQSTADAARQGRDYGVMLVAGLATAKFLTHQAETCLGKITRPVDVMYISNHQTQSQ